MRGLGGAHLRAALSGRPPERHRSAGRQEASERPSGKSRNVFQQVSLKLEPESESGRDWERARGGASGLPRSPEFSRRRGCGEWGEEQGAGSWCCWRDPRPDLGCPGLQGAGPAAARPREGVRPWPSYSKKNKARLSCKTRIPCQPPCATGPPRMHSIPTRAPAGTTQWLGVLAKRLGCPGFKS